MNGTLLTLFRSTGLDKTLPNRHINYSTVEISKVNECYEIKKASQKIILFSS